MRHLCAIAVSPAQPALTLPRGCEPMAILNDQDCNKPEAWDAAFFAYKGIGETSEVPVFVPLEHPDGSGRTRPWAACSRLASTLQSKRPRCRPIYHLIPLHGRAVLDHELDSVTARALMAADLTSTRAVSFYELARTAGYGDVGALAVELYPDPATLPRLGDYACNLVSWLMQASRMPVYVTWCPWTQPPFFPAAEMRLFTRAETDAMVKGCARAGAAGVIDWGWSHTPATAALSQAGVEQTAASLAAAAVEVEATAEEAELHDKQGGDIA